MAKNRLYTLDYLKELVADPCSDVKLKKSVREILLQPFHLRDLPGAVAEILDGYLLRYDKILNGILLGYQSAKLMDEKAPCHLESSCVSVKVEAEFYVFKPQIGSTYEAEVHKIGLAHVGCLLYDHFNISLPISQDKLDVLKKLTTQTIATFTLEEMDLSGSLPFFKGRLISAKSQSGENFMGSMDDTKKKKKKKEEEDNDGQESQRSEGAKSSRGGDCSSQFTLKEDGEETGSAKKKKKKKRPTEAHGDDVKKKKSDRDMSASQESKYDTGVKCSKEGDSSLAERLKQGKSVKPESPIENVRDEVTPERKIKKKKKRSLSLQTLQHSDHSDDDISDRTITPYQRPRKDADLCNVPIVPAASPSEKYRRMIKSLLDSPLKDLMTDSDDKSDSSFESQKMTEDAKTKKPSQTAQSIKSPRSQQTKEVASKLLSPTSHRLASETPRKNHPGSTSYIDITPSEAQSSRFKVPLPIKPPNFDSGGSDFEDGRAVSAKPTQIRSKQSDSEGSERAGKPKTKDKPKESTVFESYSKSASKPAAVTSRRRSKGSSSEESDSEDEKRRAAVKSTQNRGQDVTPIKNNPKTVSKSSLRSEPNVSSHDESYFDRTGNLKTTKPAKDKPRESSPSKSYSKTASKPVAAKPSQNRSEDSSSEESDSDDKNRLATAKPTQSRRQDLSPIKSIPKTAGRSSPVKLPSKPNVSSSDESDFERTSSPKTIKQSKDKPKESSANKSYSKTAGKSATVQPPQNRSEDSSSEESDFETERKQATAKPDVRPTQSRHKSSSATESNPKSVSKSSPVKSIQSKPKVSSSDESDFEGTSKTVKQPKDKPVESSPNTNYSKIASKPAAVKPPQRKPEVSSSEESDSEDNSRRVVAEPPQRKLEVSSSGDSDSSHTAAVKPTQKKNQDSHHGKTPKSRINSKHINELTAVKASQGVHQILRHDESRSDDKKSKVKPVQKKPEDKVSAIMPINAPLADSDSEESDSEGNKPAPKPTQSRFQASNLSKSPPKKAKSSVSQKLPSSVEILGVEGTRKKMATPKISGTQQSEDFDPTFEAFRLRLLNEFLKKKKLGDDVKVESGSKAGRNAARKKPSSSAQKKSSTKSKKDPSTVKDLAGSCDSGVASEKKAAKKSKTKQAISEPTVPVDSAKVRSETHVEKATKKSDERKKKEKSTTSEEAKVSKDSGVYDVSDIALHQTKKSKKRKLSDAGESGFEIASATGDPARKHKKESKKKKKEEEKEEDAPRHSLTNISEFKADIAVGSVKEKKRKKSVKLSEERFHPDEEREAKSSVGETALEPEHKKKKKSKKKHTTLNPASVEVVSSDDDNYLELTDVMTRILKDVQLQKKSSKSGHDASPRKRFLTDENVVSEEGEKKRIKHNIETTGSTSTLTQVRKEHKKSKKKKKFRDEGVEMLS